LSLKSDTAFDTILSFQNKLEPKTTKAQTLKTADGNGIQSIESMGKHENQSKQKFKKSACLDLGNAGSIHLSYEGNK